MDLRKLMVIIVFFLTILIIVQLAPNIQTANTTAYNTYLAATNNASMIGLGVLMPLGDILIIISIFIAAGLLTMQIQKGGGKVADIVAPVGLVIACIVSLNFYDSMITSFDTLITGASSFGKIFYGVVLMLIYLMIIALPNAYKIYSMAKEKIGSRKGKKSSSAPTPTQY